MPKLVATKRRGFSVVFHIILAILFALIANTVHKTDGNSGHFLFLAGITVICLIAVLLRWGWLLPCTLLGIIIGAACLDSPVISGSRESQMRETIASIILGTFIGFGVGLLIDSHSHAKKEQSNSSEKKQ